MDKILKKTIYILLIIFGIYTMSNIHKGLTYMLRYGEKEIQIIKIPELVEKEIDRPCRLEDLEAQDYNVDIIAPLIENVEDLEANPRF